MIREFGLEDLGVVFKEIFKPRLEECTIFTFQGPLGVGKTTLIREILGDCGVTAVITSPTFTYVNTYTGENGRIFNHFDLYRVGSQEFFVDAAFDEYLHQKTACNLIEWPAVIEDLLASDSLKSKVCKIILSYDEKDLSKRIIEVVDPI